MDSVPSTLLSYENRLSPFGQTVLKVLVNQWTSEKNYSVNRASQQKYEYMDKNSGFRHVNQFNTPCDQFRKVNNNSRKKCNLKFIEKGIPLNSTQLDLTSSIRAEEIPQAVFCRDDLVTPAIEIHSKPPNTAKHEGIEINNTYDIITGTVTDTNTNIDYFPAKLFESGFVSRDDNNITWNDMIDTEILINSNSNERGKGVNDYSIEKSEDPSIDTFKKPKFIKKRKSSTRIADQPVKLKKIAQPSTKNFYRKKKYTKTVKDWLDDVEHTNADVDSIDGIETSLVNTEKKKIQFELLKKKTSKKPVQLKLESKPAKKVNEHDGLETDKERTKKKVVQAQLANKDGKMKFKNPKDVSDVTNENVSVATKSVTGIIKEKKSRNKFVAPIKSQIPVKDITYNITRIEGSNINVYGIPLLELKDEEITILLVYSNGFCQLNGCYTEDNCFPEGLLITTGDDAFYYLTSIDNSFKVILSQILTSNTIICYEGKSILIFLSRFNMNFKPLAILDAKIGGALIDPDNPPETFSDLQKLVGFTPEFTVATDCSLQKAAWYSTLLRDCSAKLKAALVENSLWSVFVDLEMRLLPIIADMESRGVAVDMEKLQSMEQLLLTKLKVVEQQCYKAAGRTFQINSALQVRALLFDELKLDAKCNVKIRETMVKGAKSTSEATLRALSAAHALPGLVLEYRRLHKAHATFLAGIAHHVKQGVVRPTWVQTAAATGRIASSNPNLQAIPKALFSLSPEPDDDDSGSLNFRAVYVSRAGHSLLAADFRHVECRVLAHAARDAALQAALRSDDLFRVLAAQWLNKSEEEVTSADRERTKRIVYASLYGCGPRKLADMLAVSYEQALAVLASFNRTFPSLKSFGRSVVSQCERDGRLSTLCGRVRSFKHITSQDFAVKSHAERQAVNFIVQGSAADLCKMAMILAEEKLRNHSPPLRAHLVLQIHDELVWEVLDEDLDATAGVVREAMEGSAGACGAALRLPAALAAARCWGRMRALP